MPRCIAALASTAVAAAVVMGAAVHAEGPTDRRQSHADQPAAAAYEGRCLAEVLLDLQARGLAIIFSSEVVRPEMRVGARPRRDSPRRILDEILEPHGLIAQDGPAGRVIVVKNPRARVPAMRGPAREASRAAVPPQPVPSEIVEIPRFAEKVDVTGTQAWSAGVGGESFVLRPLHVRSIAGGFDDIFRVLQSLPGVASADELGSRISVRGASPDQNLTILDGIEIYNPYRLHVPTEDLGMSGLSSAFNVDAIESAELSPGAFDVRHGDRLSSLLVVRSRDGSASEAIQGSWSAGLVDANLVAEGRLPRGARGTWLVSARRSHLDLVADRLVDTALPAFHDVHAKAAWHPGAGRRLTFLTLAGAERLRVGDGVAPDDEVHETDGGNELAALTFESAIGERSTSRTIVSFSHLDDELSIAERSLSQSRASNTPEGAALGGLVDFRLARAIDMQDIAVRQELGLRAGNRHAIDAGAELHRLATRWTWRVAGDRSSLQPNGTSVRLGASLPGSLDSLQGAWRVGAWLQDRIELGPRLVVQPGLRLDRSSVTDDTTISPRLGLTWAAARETTVSAAMRLHAQSPGYEKLFQSDYFVDLGSSDADALAPERAWHAVAGVERRLPGGLTARVDAYYRRFSNLVVGRLETDEERRARLATYDVPPHLVAFVAVRPEITTRPVNGGDGRAYGGELFVARLGGAGTPLTGWGSYAWGRATRSVYGVTHPFDYDRRHAAAVTGQWKLGPRFDVAATARWSTGFPRTPADGVRLVLVPDASDADHDGNPGERLPLHDAEGLPVFEPDRGRLTNLNAARLPDFARLDLRLSYRPTWHRERWAFYLDILNVFNRRNTSLVDSTLEFDPTSAVPRVIEQPEGRGIPFFPSVSVRFWF